MKSTKDKPRRKKPPLQNPIEVAITTCFHEGLLGQRSQPPLVRLDELVAQAPRRWTVYEPMVLLPAGAFYGTAWKQVLPRLSEEQANALWRKVLVQISKRTGRGAQLTHLAINEGIPAALHHGGVITSGEEGEERRVVTENILRSPTGLRVLHGDFGTPTTSSEEPGTGDFHCAFWVSTRQNGVFQTWAPRWTMFSRGNIKEKARLLDFHGSGGRHPKGKAALTDTWAVDLYAGIGYFTFSYAKLGMRVLCWELNFWSVEGLRRGARANGWAVRVVHPDDPVVPMRELLEGGEQIVVFLEDNRCAARRVEELAGAPLLNPPVSLNVLHVNCGLLPTSEGSWADAWDISTRGRGKEAWLHLHENVGEADIEKRRGEIEGYFLDLARKSKQEKGGDSRTAHVEHTELVKTFAPGVWHCVFDLHITKSSSIR
ncbi:S-adenosylmethionine-dependent methyltransferase [Parahypoxylon ruwenzoriense]